MVKGDGRFGYIGRTLFLLDPSCLDLRHGETRDENMGKMNSIKKSGTSNEKDYVACVRRDKK